ncbi:MAG: ribonuclease H-like domain-containing protein [Phycisphaeraceae bacterium]
MLKQSFCHLPGVGQRSEHALWASGIDSWSALADPAAIKLAPRRRDTLKRQIDESAHHLDAGHAGYFGNALPSDQVWRLFPEFRDSIAYLDIETTGLSGMSDQITTIALYDGRQVRHYVNGQNLDDFPRDVQDYKVIVSYNGKCFDVPFMRCYFGIQLDQAHIDLRYVLKSLGYRGGLKGCERQLGMSRGELDGVDGFFAVLLWHEYQRHGDVRALETLLAYNIQDVLNLETLMVKAYNAKLNDTPFGGRLTLPAPPVMSNPFQADAATIARLTGQPNWDYGRTIAFGSISPSFP